jgi:hypothetical protein
MLWRPGKTATRAVAAALVVATLPLAAADEGRPRSLADPCSLVQQGRRDWLDRIHDWTTRVICTTILGFDGFFGDSRAEDVKELPSGMVGLQLHWSEDELFWTRARFRLRFDLPNLSRKFKGFLGRESEGEYLTDRAENSEVRELSRQEPYHWVAGLGATPLRGERFRVRLSGGVTVSTSPQLYGKGRYWLLFPLGPSSLGRFSQTVFWRNRDGAGTTTGLDLERRYGDRFLLRWGTDATISEVSAGVEWYTSLTLYQEFTVDSAAYYRAWVRGATDAPVPTGEYGIHVTWRRRILRKWLFAEIGGGVSWIRRHPWDPRRASVGVTVGTEMQFGPGSGY